MSKKLEAREFLAPSPYKRKCIFYTVFSSKISVDRPLFIALRKAALQYFLKVVVEIFQLTNFNACMGYQKAGKEKSEYCVLCNNL